MGKMPPIQSWSHMRQKDALMVAHGRMLVAESRRRNRILFRWLMLAPTNIPSFRTPSSSFWWPSSSCLSCGSSAWTRSSDTWSRASSLAYTGKRWSARSRERTSSWSLSWFSCSSRLGWSFRATVWRSRRGTSSACPAGGNQACDRRMRAAIGVGWGQAVAIGGALPMPRRRSSCRCYRSGESDAAGGAGDGLHRSRRGSFHGAYVKLSRWAEIYSGNSFCFHVVSRYYCSGSNSKLKKAPWALMKIR